VALPAQWTIALARRQSKILVVQSEITYAAQLWARILIAKTSADISMPEYCSILQSTSVDDKNGVKYTGK